MIVEPEQRVADFAKAGADIISIHVEQQSTIHLHRTVNMVSWLKPGSPGLLCVWTACLASIRTEQGKKGVGEKALVFLRAMSRVHKM
jgi:hypothetical protein